MVRYEIENSGIEIQLEEGSSPEVIQILADTTYGIEGRLRYTHVGTSERIKHTPGLSFIQVKRNQRILGVTGVIKRDTDTLTGKVQALYIRYLSMPGAFKNSPTNHVSTSQKQGVIRTYLHKVFEYLEREADENIQRVCYAVVERDNIPSQNMCRMHKFEKVREMDTHLFSRFRFQKHEHIRRLYEKEEPLFKAKLKTFYTGYNFFFTDNLFNDGICLVAERDGRIVGGIKGRPVQWKLLEVPGLSGFLMLNVLPYIPFLCRLFKKETLDFVALEALWVHKGYEDELEHLMEAMLSHFGRHIGILWSDSESSITSLIQKNVSLGFMSKVQQNVPADLLIRYGEGSEEERACYTNHPMYISAGDIT